MIAAESACPYDPGGVHNGSRKSCVTSREKRVKQMPKILGL